MSNSQLEGLVAGLRANGPDFTQPPLEVRAHFEAMLGTIPVADDLVFTDITLGGVPALKSVSPGAAEDAALLYFHGGAYVVGSAKGYRSLAAELGRATGITAYPVEYRKAPEHVYPAAVEDALAAYRGLLDLGISPSRIVIAGDSAGAGLALAALISLRDAGLAQPAAALLISPWVDLTCSGESIKTKAAEDPSLDEAGLRAMAGHYLAGQDAGASLASPLFGALDGLPPLLIQVGSAEILLDDATRLARTAGAQGVSVHLEIWPGMVHVWHAFAFMLDAGRDAIRDAGAFLASHIQKV